MPIVNAREITVKAAEGRYAIGAFNVSNLIQLEGVVDAAVEKRSPVILQATAGTAAFLGGNVLVALYRAIASAAPVPICLHLNHCHEVDYCRKCADLGFTGIMIDASDQPYEENIRRTRQVAEYCHKVGGISVEAELGTVGAVEEQIAEDEAQLANPEQAAEFVERTGVDILAPAFGTAHGIYKTQTPKIDIERLAAINRRLNGDCVKTPLVVHGASGLPDEYVRLIIEAGGAQFNVSTELKRALIDAQYEYISPNRQEYDPGKVDIAVRDAIRKVAGRWIDLLGSAGKA